jgi:hypothetical protein
MKKYFSVIIFNSLVLLSIFFLGVNVTSASVSVGAISSGFTTAKICKDVSCTTYGVVNFKPTINGNTPGALPITITDSGITGHAWGNEIGWINMSPTGSGVIVNPTTGILSGKAYANVGSWINFAPTYPGSGPQVGVTLVDNGTGSNFQGWAWVSGAHGGWMKFDCSGTGTCVKTDWRAIPYRFICSDGIDNDGDTLIDYPNDPGCTSSSDTDETNITTGGGGGGGSGGGGGNPCASPLVYSNGVCVNPNVLPQTQPTTPQNQCGPYLLKYIKLGAKNDPIEVKKLQKFLVDHEGETLKIDGRYKLVDFNAVKRFQVKYSGDVLGPWGSIKSTGYVYKTTVAKINSFMCPNYTEKIVIEKLNTNQCPIFKKYHRIGSVGGDVSKIINFLNKEFSDAKLRKSIIYTPAVAKQVKRYQEKYYSDIITKAGLQGVTGIWAKYSMEKANSIEGCPL